MAKWCSIRPPVASRWASMHPKPCLFRLARFGFVILSALPAFEVIMNVRAEIWEAERAQSEGNAIYERLLPIFKEQGLKPGNFVAINIATGEFVVAENRIALMSSYKERFGQAVGWVRRIEYQSN